MDRVEISNFFDAVFNPSTLVRFFHTVDGAFITGAFFIVGVCAYLIIKKRETEIALKGIKIGIISGLIFSLLQVFPFGHESARVMYKTQPEKFAAIMGLYNSQTDAPIMVFAYPANEGEQPVLKAPIEIPKLLSYLVFFPGDPQAFRGLNTFSKKDIPPLWMTFVSYHNMVLLGVIFILLMIWGAIQMKRKKLLLKTVESILVTRHCRSSFFNSKILYLNSSSTSWNDKPRRIINFFSWKFCSFYDYL